MGVVYAVTSPHLPRERALKLLLPGADPDSRTRFRREAELLARVRHPGVVAIHEIGEAEQGLYLVMDLVPGEPLDHVLRRGPATAEQARVWILEVADALAAVHDHDLLHRDLKPANLILRPDGHLVLLDFGLARSAGGSSLTETGGITGSPGFLAPEQARGLKVLTPAVDVHGLGTTLFSFLSGGVPPFRGATTLATVAAVLNQEANWPGDLPPDLLAVGRRALAKDPSERFPDARAFAAALRLPESAEVPPAPAPSRSLLALVVGALCLVLLVSAAWIASLEGAPAPPPSAEPSPAASRAAPWARLPKGPGEQARWFRETWLRWRGGQEPSPVPKRDFRRLLRDPLYSLPVRTRERATASFWGSERWVYQRAEGLAWGRVGTFPMEVEGSLDAEVKGIVEYHPGRALTLFNLGAEPRGWRVAAPGKEPTLLALPKADFLKGAKFEGFAFSERRVCMFTATHAWELDLERPESYRLAHETPRGEHEEATYTSSDQLVLAVSGPTQPEVHFAEGQPRVGLEGAPRALAVHPLLPLIAIGDRNGRVQLWSYEAGAELVRLREHDVTRRVRALVFDLAGHLLYSAAGLTADTADSRGELGQVQVWRRGPEGSWGATRVIGFPFTPDHLSLSPDGAWLLVSGRAGQVFLYAAGDPQGP